MIVGDVRRIQVNDSGKLGYMDAGVEPSGVKLGGMFQNKNGYRNHLSGMKVLIGDDQKVYLVSSYDDDTKPEDDYLLDQYSYIANDASNPGTHADAVSKAISKRRQ